jgi:transglutaminase-like putative cysteine protease
MRLLFIGILCLISVNVYAVNEDLAKNKAISDEITQGCLDNRQKILAISHYVYLKLKPDASKGITPEMQMNTSDRLESGIGWCNHQVSVFMRLCEAQHIKTRMLYLINKEGTSSPHTIGEAYLDGKWVIVDPQNDLQGLYSRYEALHNPQLLIDELRKQEKFKAYTEEQFKDFIDLYTNPALLVYGLE